MLYRALWCAEIAQSVEQRTENPCVAGSIPALGILLLLFYVDEKYWQYLLIVLLICSMSAVRAENIGSLETDSNFIIKPYLQLGNHPLLEPEEKLELLWVQTVIKTYGKCKLN